jgi:NAD-dependent SIR2 family protein deacetylase
MDEYQKVADIIKKEGNVVAFTGSGISVDSGIPTFRGGQDCGRNTIPWNTPI